MADDIEQSLGFDASDAIQAVSNLDRQMGDLTNAVNNTAGALGSFSTGGNAAVNILDELKQKADSAAGSLNKLNNSGGLLKGNDAADALNRLLGQTGEGLPIPKGNPAAEVEANLRNSFRNIAAEANKAADDTEGATGKIGLSFGLLGRIVFTQTVIKGLREFETALVDSVGAALKFDEAVSRLSLVDSAGRSVAQLKNEIRDLSTQLNAPLLETAAAQLQTLKAGFTDAASQVLILSNADDLAKTTGASLGDSVGAITNALNAYGLSAQNAAQISSTLFAIQSKGKIDIATLSDTVGRLFPRAEALGISLEQIGAALQTVTLRSVNSKESITALASIITAIEKPGKALKELFTAQGFQSGEEATRALGGLPGVLQLIADKAGGSNAALAGLLPNIRGLNGATALTTDGLEAFTKNLTSLKAVEEDLNKTKALQQATSDSEKFTKAMNTLANDLEKGVGEKILSLGSGLTQIPLLFHTVEGVVQNLIPLLGDLGAALGVAFLQTKGLAGAFGTLGFSAAGMALAIPIAFQLGDAIGNLVSRFQHADFSQLNQISAAVEQNLGAIDNANNIHNKQQTARDQAYFQAFSTQSQDAREQYVRDIASIKSADAGWAAAQKSSLNDITNLWQRLGGAVSGAEPKAEQSVKQNELAVQTLESKRETLDVENHIQDVGLRGQQAILALQQSSTGQSRAQKAIIDQEVAAKQKEVALQQEFVLAQAAAEARSKAAKNLAGATTEQEQKRAEQLFNQAQQYDKQREALAAQQNDLGQVKRAQDSLNDTVNAQESAYKRLNQRTTQQAQQAEALRPALSEQLGTIEALDKIVKDNTGNFDAQGNLIDENTRKLRAQARDSAIGELTKLTVPQTALQAPGDVGKIAREVQSKLDSAKTALKVQVKFDDQQFEAAFRLATQKFQAGLKDQGIDLGKISLASGKTLEELNSPAKVNNTIQQLQAQAQGLDKNLQAIDKDQTALKGVNSELDELAKKSKEAVSPESRGQFGGFGVGKFQTDLEDVRKSLDFSRDHGFTGLDEAQAKLKALTQSAASDGKLSAAFKSQFAGATEDLAAYTLKLQQAKQLRDQLFKEGGSDQTAVAAKQAQAAQLRDAIGQAPLDPAVQASVTIKQNAIDTRDAYVAGATALVNAKNAPSTGGVPAPTGNGTHFGQVGFFSQGGSTRGMDSIPAMLAPGETVINAKQSKAWFSQLSAINAGMNPIFRDKGGPVTTNVGDIHVNVSTEGKVNGKEIAKAIQRAMRSRTAAI